MDRQDAFSQSFVEIAGEMVEALSATDTHKHLGRKLSGDLTGRAKAEIAHRMGLAWMKFNQHRGTLVNHNVSVSLRLRLFDAACLHSH